MKPLCVWVQDLPFGKLKWKLIFQPLSARVYVNLLEGIFLYIYVLLENNQQKITIFGGLAKIDHVLTIGHYGPRSLVTIGHYQPLFTIYSHGKFLAFYKKNRGKY
jgi:hypothetical protein